MKVIGIAVTSLDGYITKHGSPGVGFASQADQQFFKKSLAVFDCSVFGAKTFEVSKESILRGLHHKRLRIVITRNPAKYKEYEKKDVLEFHNKSALATLNYLKNKGKHACAILGGSQIYSEYLRQGLLYELWLTIEPRLFGRGKKLIQEKVDVELTLQRVERLADNTILLRYKKKKPNARVQAANRALTVSNKR